MTSIPGYRILEELHASARTKVSRALREADNMPVVLKQGATLTSQHLLALEREFYLLRKFDSDTVLTAYRVDKTLDVQALVLEDFGATSLAQSLQSSEWDLHNLLRISIDIVD